jgi:hypothetical protein
MSLKKKFALLFPLFLISFLFICNGCSPVTPPLATQPPPGGKPDSVQVEVYHYLNANPAIYITDTKAVQQLYTMLYALPAMPHEACPAIAGPRYILTFNQGGKQLTAANFEHIGCSPVSIQGDSQARQLTSAYWSFLQQSTNQAIATNKMTQLAIQPASQSGQPGQPGQPVQKTMQITSVATIQRLYTAILALQQPSSCPSGSNSIVYQLAFHATNQLIPVQIGSTECNVITLHTTFYDKSYRMDENFEQLLKQAIASASFKPAVPDKLSITLNYNNHIEVHDTTLIQSFYQNALTLQSSNQGGCPSSVSEKYYSFLFSQWDLPLQQFTTNEVGNCTQITNGFSPDVNLQGNSEFWDFVHRTTGQK